MKLSNIHESDNRLSIETLDLNNFEYWLSHPCYSAERAADRIKSGGENLPELVTGYPDYPLFVNKNERIQQDLERIRETIEWLKDFNGLWEEYEEHVKENSSPTTLYIISPDFNMEDAKALAAKEVKNLEDLYTSLVYGLKDKP